jgi:hypothetical protein
MGLICICFDNPLFRFLSVHLFPLFVLLLKVERDGLIGMQQKYEPTKQECKGPANLTTHHRPEPLTTVSVTIQSVSQPQASTSDSPPPSSTPPWHVSHLQQETNPLL